MPWLRIDLALWLLLAVLWVVAAPFSRKTVRKEPLGSRARFVIPLALCAILLSSRILAFPWLDTHRLPAEAWTGVLSVALTALGVSFAAWARLTLGKNWSGTVTVKQDHELVRTGPYALARHPIYTGALVALLGTLAGVGTLRSALALLVVIASLRFKMRAEEQFMSDQFGEAYTRYRQEVKALIPFLW